MYLLIDQLNIFCNNFYFSSSDEASIREVLNYYYHRKNTNFNLNHNYIIKYILNLKPYKQVIFMSTDVIKLYLNGFYSILLNNLRQIHICLLIGNRLHW